MSEFDARVAGVEVSDDIFEFFFTMGPDSYAVIYISVPA